MKLELVCRIDGISVLYDITKNHYLFSTQNFPLSAYRGSCVKQMFNRYYFDVTGNPGVLK